MATLALPPDVARQLHKAQHATAGLDGTSHVAWLFTRASLSVWQYGVAGQGLLSRHMPYAEPVAHYVSLMVLDPSQPLRQLAVALCSEDGNLSLWDDFGNAQSDAYQIRVGDRVTATASVSSGAAGARSFVTVVGTQDGQLRLVQAVQQGGGTMDSHIQHFDPSAASADAAAAGTAGGAPPARSLSSPASGHVGDSPSGEASLQLHLVPLPRGDGWLLVNVTRHTVDCWQVPLGPGHAPPRFLSSLSLAAALAGRLGPRAELRCVALASDHVSADNDSIAAVALVEMLPTPPHAGAMLCAVPLQLSAGSAGGSPALPHVLGCTELGGAALAEFDMGQNSGGGGGGDGGVAWRCCCGGGGDTPSDALLLWAEGGPAYLADLATGHAVEAGTAARHVLAAVPAIGPVAHQQQQWVALDRQAGLLLLQAGGAGQGAAHAHDNTAAVHHQHQQQHYGAAAMDDDGGGGDVNAGMGEMRPAAGAAAAAGAARGERGEEEEEEEGGARYRLPPDAAATCMEALDAAVAGHIPPAALERRLSNTGAMRVPGSANPVAAFSRALVDALPKHLAAGGGGGAGAAAASAPGAGADVSQQLQGKAEAHRALLQVLAEGQVLRGMEDPLVLRLLFEHGEQLAAVASVRELENSVLLAAAAGSSGGGGAGPIADAANANPASAAARLLQDLVREAGHACVEQLARAGGGGSNVLQERSPWEVFYSRVTDSSSALMRSVSAAAHTVGGEPQHAASELADVLQYHRLLQAALGAAQHQMHGYQVQYAAYFNIALGQVQRPDWTAGPAARSALRACADACSRVASGVASAAPERRPEAAAALLQLTEQVLNAYAAALVAAPARERPGLSSSYADARDSLLQQLAEEGMALASEASTAQQQQRGQQQRGGGGAAAAAAATAAGQLLQRVRGLAEAHDGYSQLFDICRFLGDSRQLHLHMAGILRDGEPAFAYYVFGRLYSAGRLHELLTLPDEFNTPLACWMDASASVSDPSPDLLRSKALHERRVGHLSHAAATLADLAGAATREGAAMAVPQRALALARLAAMAADGGGEEGMEGGGTQLMQQQRRRVAEQVDRQLVLMRAQAALGMAGQPAADPADLLSAALADGRGADGAVLALQVFVLGGGSGSGGQQLAEQHSGMLQAACHKVAAASDWPGLVQRRASLPDAEFGELLRCQPLAAAASHCYGPHAAAAGNYGASAGAAAAAGDYGAGAGAVAAGGGGGALSPALAPSAVLALCLEAVPAAPISARECARSAFELGMRAGALPQ